MKKLITTATAMTVSALVLGGNAQAATWAGGSGSWTSAGVNNWSLGTGHYPGDADTHGGEAATLSAAGTIGIGSGDTINLTGSQTFQTAIATVDQTGGSMTVANNVRVGNGWSLSGTGALTFSGGLQFFNSGSGASVDVSGGTFVGGAMQWRGSGDVTVSGGSFTAAAMDLGFDASGTGTIGVIGTGATTVQATSMIFADGAGAKTASFTFDGSGVDNWTLVGGGTVLTLDSSSALTVDLGTYDAVNGALLFDYNNGGIGLSGTFNTATVTSDIYGTMTLGSGPSGLAKGQYFIGYNDSLVGDGGAIVLYANNIAIPEPSTLALLGIGGLLLAARKRRG